MWAFLLAELGWLLALWTTMRETIPFGALLGTLSLGFALEPIVANIGKAVALAVLSLFMRMLQGKLEWREKRKRLKMNAAEKFATAGARFANGRAAREAAERGARRVLHPKHGPGSVLQELGDGRCVVKFDNGDEHVYTPESQHKLAPGPPKLHRIASGGLNPKQAAAERGDAIEQARQRARDEVARLKEMERKLEVEYRKVQEEEEALRRKRTKLRQKEDAAVELVISSRAKLNDRRRSSLLARRPSQVLKPPKNAAALDRARRARADDPRRQQRGWLEMEEGRRI